MKPCTPSAPDCDGSGRAPDCLVPACPLRATHYWRIRRHLPERHGQACRVLARARPVRDTRPGREGKTWSAHSVLVAFADGRRVVSSAWSIRRLPVPA